MLHGLYHKSKMEQVVRKMVRGEAQMRINPEGCEFDPVEGVRRGLLAPPFQWTKRLSLLFHEPIR